MNNTNVVLSLDARREKKDGTYPILLRLVRGKVTLPIKTGYSVLEKDWDEKKREVKKSYVGIMSTARLNNILQDKRRRASSIILKLEEDGKLALISLSEIKDRIERQNISPSFFKFANEQIKNLKEANRFGTARSYACAVSVLKDFINGTDRYADRGKTKRNNTEKYMGKDLSFSEITYDLLKRLETQHYKHGNTANGLAVYMRTIRAIFNNAIKAGLVEREIYPFTNYAIKTVPTQKLALDLDMLNKIINAEIKEEDNSFNARNYFVASYMMYGMSFADMAYLQKTDIIGERIKYRRRKTGKLYDIKVTPALDEILSHYTSRYTNSPYVFPILKRDEPQLQDKDMQWARKRYNETLKALGKRLDLPDSFAMSTKVTRHSFATQALLLDIPVAAISAMLGHSSLKTTETYLKGLPSNVLDEFNKKILQRG